MSVAIRKRKSTMSIISYALSRISRSTMAWILFVLALICLNATVIATSMIVKKKDVAGFKLDIQYAIIIFINVFLFLFTVMNVVKLYSDQLADGSFLLLVSKPYNRFTIFMCQFLAIWIAQVSFILINLSTVLLTGFILSKLTSMTWLFMTLFKLLTQLTIYTLIFSFVTICGSILLATLLSTQIVFLILVIFCSLFLMGGMPYSLFKEIANTTQIVIKVKNASNGDLTDSVRSIRNIKKAILFKDKLKQKKIKYQHVTKKIFDLLEKNPTLVATFQTNARNKKLIEMFDKDMNLYRPIAYNQQIKGKIMGWSNFPAGIINGKDFEMSIAYSKYFKNPNDSSAVNQLDSNNIYHKEILEMIKEYDDIGISLYMDNKKSSAANLLEFDETSSYFKVKDLIQKDPADPSKTIKVDITSHFNGKVANDLDHGPEYYFERLGEKRSGSSITYVLDRTSMLKYKEVYLNPVPYILNTVATIVAETIRERNEIAVSKVSRNSNFEKYETAMNSYQIINYLNFIEHWNQLWSRLIDEEPFWYDPLEEKFNFESQMNYLLSYEDFPLQLNDKGCIDINKIEYFQNWLYVLIAYLSASLIFLIASIMVINRKDIT